MTARDAFSSHETLHSPVYRLPETSMIFSSPVLLINDIIRYEDRSKPWESEFGVEKCVDNERHWFDYNIKQARV